MQQPKRILVVQPSWVGDAVMATPTLRALRERYPEAHISYLCRRYVKAMYTGLPYADRVITYRTGKTKSKTSKGMLKVATRLRKGKFDTAILLTNSFKTALLCKFVGIKRIIGYDRDSRGFLLSDRLLPYKEKGKFVPSPMVHYYLGLTHYLGSRSRDIRMELRVTPAERQRAQQVLVRCGLDADLEKPHDKGQGPLVMINAGAQYGAAKCWLPEHFAAVADRLIQDHSATILLSGTPKERRIMDAIQRHMRHAAVDLTGKGLTLGALKELVRRCDLMVTNDTGPRHIAAAFGVPVVTIFGPTHPEWTEISFDLERKVQTKVFCGPCQKKVCPLDHRCMTQITPDKVYATALELLDAKPAHA
jgi:lipopolysaccharide heptosyltransferase II